MDLTRPQYQWIRLGGNHWMSNSFPFGIERGDAVLTVLRAGLGGHPLALQACLDASWRRYQID
jgi:hypothetical protein